MKFYLHTVKFLRVNFIHGSGGCISIWFEGQAREELKVIVESIRDSVPTIEMDKYTTKMYSAPKELHKVSKAPAKVVIVFFFQMAKGKWCEVYKA